MPITRVSRYRNIGERIHRLILGMCVSAPPHLFLSLLYIISLSEIALAKRTRDERERSSRRERGSWKKRDIVTQERQQQSGQRARATRATRVTQGDTVPNLGERGREHCGSPPFLPPSRPPSVARQCGKRIKVKIPSQTLTLMPCRERPSRHRQADMPPTQAVTHAGPGWLRGCSQSHGGGLLGVTKCYLCKSVDLQKASVRQ